MTQGDLVLSMDQLLTKPRLGTCHKFYMQPFTLANSKQQGGGDAERWSMASEVLEGFLSSFPDDVKTLMFFEGCATHLGCSIKLRGALEYELARVKDIIMLMVCVAYHSQLEISFLMDEFAMPPSLSQSTSFPSLLEGTAAEEQEADGQKKEKSEEGQDETSAPGAEDPAPGGQADKETPPSESSSKNGEINKLKSPLSSVQSQEAGNPETMTSSPFTDNLAPPLSVSPPFLMEDDQATSSDTLIRAFDGETGEEGSLVKGDSLGPEDEEGSVTPTPRLFRDPLQDDTGLFVAEEVASSDDRLKSISAVFKQELNDIILCISPFITFREPFLLTAAGMHCPSRDYFPEQVPGPQPDIPRSPQSSQLAHLCLP